MRTFFWLAQDAAHHSEVSTVLGNSLVILVSFIVLLVLLNKFAVGPVLNMITKREEAIAQQLDHAQTTVLTAQEQEETAQRLVEEAKKQAQQILMHAKEQGEQLKEDMLTQTKEDIVRLRQEAKDVLDKERQDVLQQATKSVGESTVLLTQKLLKREISSEDHQQLINDFIEGLD